MLTTNSLNLVQIRGTFGLVPTRRFASLTILIIDRAILPILAVTFDCIADISRLVPLQTSIDFRRLPVSSAIFLSRLGPAGI